MTRRPKLCSRCHQASTATSCLTPRMSEHDANAGQLLIVSTIQHEAIGPLSEEAKPHCKPWSTRHDDNTSRTQTPPRSPNSKMFIAEDSSYVQIAWNVLVDTIWAWICIFLQVLLHCHPTASGSNITPLVIETKTDLKQSNHHQQQPCLPPRFPQRCAPSK